MRTKRTAALAIAIFCVGLVGVHEAQGQSRLVSPVITGVTPQSPMANPELQLLTITGNNFLAGVTVNVATPDGRVVAFTGAAVRMRRETTFQVSIALTLTGAYTLTATNPDGGTSDQYVVRVQAPMPATMAPPKIDRVLPDLISKDPQPQVLKISGERFAPGLSVSMTDPIGTVYLIKGAALGALTATSFDLSVALEMVGDYSLMVTNPSGQSSNSVTVKVTMRRSPR